MALSFASYADLKTAIGNELNRPDLVGTGEVAGFITLAEAELKRELRRKSSISAFTFSSGALSKALPATVAELRALVPAISVARPQGGKPLVLLTWEEFNEKRANLALSGVPRFYTVVNQTVYLAPAPSDDNLDFVIQSYDALVSVSSDLTLLTEAPDLLFYGALVHSAPFLEHDERLDMWVKFFTQAIDSMNDLRQREEFGQSLKRARLPRQFAGGGRIV